jgi:hypothetical protein
MTVAAAAIAPLAPAPPDTAALDASLAHLAAQRQRLAVLPAPVLRQLLEAVAARLAGASERWVTAVLAGCGWGQAEAGEQWLIGPYAVLRYLRLLRGTLLDLERDGRPNLPQLRQRTNGQQSLRVFPYTPDDALIILGTTAEVWLDPALNQADVLAQTAQAYRQDDQTGALSLLLAAGNVSGLTATDLLYILVVKRQVVLVKLNPVNDYLYPLLTEVFAPLIEQGFLAFVRGNATVGAYLVDHALVEAIHITGSDKSYNAIVFGPPSSPRAVALTKPVYAELGAVGPVIVVPGVWTEAELAYQAEHLAWMFTFNGGYNCVTPRVLLLAADWPQRGRLLQLLAQQLAAIPSRRAFYPGTEQNYNHLRAENPALPAFQPSPAWALVTDIAPDSGALPLRCELFGPMFAEVALPALAGTDFLAQAVAFANHQLWGTLSANIIIHPSQTKTAAARRLLEQALEDLHYGMIGVNSWAGLGYNLFTGSWGAAPGHQPQDIQSGNGSVMNPLMLPSPQKTIIRGPFVMPMKPPWFPSHANGLAVARLVTRFEGLRAQGRLAAGLLPQIIWAALAK